MCIGGITVNIHYRKKRLKKSHFLRTELHGNLKRTGQSEGYKLFLELLINR